MNIEEQSSRKDVTERLLNELSRLLKTLQGREAQILKLRFGLENGHPHTLQEVADRFHVSRERIRQIEGRALLKLAIEL